MGQFSFAQNNIVWKKLSRSEDTRPAFKQAQAPFYHGVASGDPTQNSVIIWTRVTPELNEESIDVKWYIATDTSFLNMVASGTFTTDASRDYTVKVDVSGLEPQNTYFYVFLANGKYSPVGRTRTAATDSEHLRFGIVSCANYQHGYFNSYKRLAERNDLDAIIHLGDYIYEYEEFADATRPDLLPQNEIIALGDYRMRHSYYKLDPDLQALHQMYPFITIWDDHETANDSYKDGAENHDPATEGDWETRKNNGKTAYFEWMPIRDNADKRIYRTISYGNLAELIMLDTRLEGREKQIESIDEPAYTDPNRTIMGDEQDAWFREQITNSSAQWKLIGNQVIFSPLNLAQLIPVNAGALTILADIWEGYPAERNNLIQFIKNNDIANVVFLTGDIHATFAFDIYDTDSTATAYNPETGEGSVAVEMVTPSISSDNFDEYLGASNASILQGVLEFYNNNIKKINFVEHGYYVLDITPEKVQGDWYFDSNRLIHNDIENYVGSVYANNNAPHLIESESEASGKPVGEIPPPTNDPTIIEVGLEANEVLPQNMLLLNAYPNPTANQTLTLNIALDRPQTLQLQLIDMQGKVLLQQKNQNLSSGIFGIRLNVNSFPAGNYIINLRNNFAQEINIPVQIVK